MPRGQTEDKQTRGADGSRAVGSTEAPTAELRDTLIAEFRRWKIPAIRRILRASPEALDKHEIPLDDARDILNPALEALIAYLEELDASPPDHLAPPVIAQRLKSAPDRASLTWAHRAILRRLDLAMVRGQLAEIRMDDELMARLDAEAARTLRGTGRSPRGATLDTLADILERENQNRPEAEEEDDDA